MKDIIAAHNAGFQRRKQWPELFDLNVWRKAESYSIIKKFCDPMDAILEIGCLTGHHLLLLAEDGYNDLTGIDFCEEAVKWGVQNNKNDTVKFYVDEWNRFSHNEYPTFDKIILFDVLEHVHNVKHFLQGVISALDDDGTVLILVPAGQHYMDEGHINFWPSPIALDSLLRYYFTIIRCVHVEGDKKIFAECKKIGAV